MSKYVLCCGGSSVAPQIEVLVKSDDEETAMQAAMNYSEMICNRYYWRFSLNKDDKPFRTWDIDQRPAVKNMIIHEPTT